MNSGVGFGMILAALRVSDDHSACARVAQHLGGNIARERAAFPRVAILPADGERGSLGLGRQRHAFHPGHVGGETRHSHLVAIAPNHID